MMHLSNNIRRASSPDGDILLDLRRGTMFRLNPVGSRILDLLIERESTPGITERISVEFGVPVEVVQTDLGDFLGSLQLHGVLDASGPTAQAGAGD